MTRPSFEASFDTRAICKALLAVPIGGEITYASLGEAVGRTVDGADSSIQSALRICLTKDEAVFENIRGVGYRRLTDEEIVNASGRDNDALRRKARKSARKLTSVQDMTALPAEKRIEHNARLSLFAAMMAMTKPKAIEAVKTVVAKVGGELPFAKTLEAFRRSDPPA